MDSFDTYTPTITRIETEVLVLGAGPGGYTAAFRSADLGKKVVIVERGPGCLRGPPPWPTVTSSGSAGGVSGIDGALGRSAPPPGLAQIVISGSACIPSLELMEK